MNFAEMEREARDEFEDHIINCLHGPDKYYQRTDEVGIREDEFYEEAYQIKMVDELIKVKWEMPCSWVGCSWHLYYCKMTRAAQWLTPYEIVMEESE